ncbi:MAG: hypothetical protein LBQ54_12105 [Planctomycetaceae bacterium]|nr:hypothetical protein [Planctomycetaceae bacterium]
MTRLIENDTAWQVLSRMIYVAEPLFPLQDTDSSVQDEPPCYEMLAENRPSLLAIPYNGIN